MKIIKMGNVPDQEEIPKTCKKCNTEFTYVKSDIQLEWRDGDHVICPCCGNCINV